MEPIGKKGLKKYFRRHGFASIESCDGENSSAPPLIYEATFSDPHGKLNLAPKAMKRQ